MSGRAGIIYVKVDGTQFDAKGEFNYNLGYPKLSAIIGADNVHGPKSEVQVSFVEGKVTDDSNLKIADIVLIRDATVTLELENGKTVVWRNAWYAGEGNVTTSEGEIDFRFESRRPAEEI